MKFTVSGSLNFQLEEEAKPGFLWSINSNGIITKNVSMLILPNDHKCVATIQPVDAKGNPAQIDGLPAWSSSSPAIAAVNALSADGTGTFSAEIIPGDQLGTCQINVSADADIGSGITNISGVLDVQVAGGQAVGFTITTAPPVPIS